MQKLSRLIYILPIVLAGLLGDQLTKIIAKKYLESGSNLSFLFNTVQFQYIENHGGFLGYLNIIPESFRFYLLTIGVGLLLVVSTYLLVISNNISSSQVLLISCIVAGGMGNLLDRLINNGGVIDFVSIGIGSFRTGIFNFADVLILFCSFALGLSLTRD